MGQTRSLSNKEGRPSPCVLPPHGGNGAQTGRCLTLATHSKCTWSWDLNPSSSDSQRESLPSDVWPFYPRRLALLLSQWKQWFRIKKFPPWEHVAPDSLPSTCVCASCSAHLPPIISHDKLRPTPALLSVLLGLFTTKYKNVPNSTRQRTICEFFISFFSLEFLFSSSMPGTVKGTQKAKIGLWVVAGQVGHRQLEQEGRDRKA